MLEPQNVNYGHKDIEMEEEEEDPQLADDDLTIDVFNFPQTLNITKSFKHKLHDLVNEQSYTATLRDSVITYPSATLGDIHNQL